MTRARRAEIFYDATDRGHPQAEILGACRLLFLGRRTEARQHGGLEPFEILSENGFAHRDPDFAARRHGQDAAAMRAVTFAAIRPAPAQDRDGDHRQEIGMPVENPEASAFVDGADRRDVLQVRRDCGGRRDHQPHGDRPAFSFSRASARPPTM